MKSFRHILLKPTATIKEALKIIDSGADFIIGHHAHMIQSFEEYKGKKIFYGVGNCVFPDFKLRSHFDGSSFTKISAKKQREHNKKSLMININEQLNVSFNKLYFDGVGLQYQKNKINNFFIPKSREIFESKYNMYKKIDMIKKFFESPKIPNIQQIKRLITKEKIK